MISKEKLKQETQKAIESSENKRKEDFNSSIALVNKALDAFFAEVKKKKHNEAIEKICLESANEGHTFARFSLFQDDYFDKAQSNYVLSVGAGCISDLHFMKKYFNKLAFIRVAFCEHFRTIYDRRVRIGVLEIENDNYRFRCIKKYSYHGLEFSICLKLCDGTIDCFAIWSL